MDHKEREPTSDQQSLEYRYWWSGPVPQHQYQYLGSVPAARGGRKQVKSIGFLEKTTQVISLPEYRYWW